MAFTLKRNIQIVAWLLLALVITQAVFTALFNFGISGPRPLLWGLEGVLFTVLAAFAGAVLVQAKSYHLGWSAIAFSAVLNVIQVTIRPATRHDGATDWSSGCIFLYDL